MEALGDEELVLRLPVGAMSYDLEQGYAVAQSQKHRCAKRRAEVVC